MANRRKIIVLSSRSRDSDEGFVLITALMVIFLIVTIVTTVALVTASDLRAAAKARAIITTRFMAESVTDSVYASIAKERNGFVNQAIRNFSNDKTAFPTVGNNPLFNSAGATPDYGGWFLLKSDGEIENCNTIERVKQTCFRAKIIQTSSSALSKERVVLHVIARGGCIVSSPTIPTNCVYRTFRQEFRTRTFIETVSLTNSEVPSPDLPGYAGIPENPATPSVPFPVAYLPQDRIVGTVQTNGDKFFRCGNVVGLGSTATFESLSGLSESLNVADCLNSDPAFTTATGPVRFLPSQVNTAGGNESITNPSSIFKDLAGGLTLGTYNRDANTDIVLQANGIRFNGSPTVQAYPANGVIFVKGSVSISGNYSRSLSVVATENVTISGSLEMVQNSGAIFNGISGAPNDSDPYLGILTAKNIVVKCNQVGTQCSSVNIVGVLSAPGGTIYNDLWNSALNNNPANPPKINIFGTIIANNRAVFGSYVSNDGNPISQGQVRYGWSKSLAFDQRLEEYQPPYFFRTSQASVVRSGLQVSGCNGADEPFCD